MRAIKKRFLICLIGCLLCVGAGVCCACFSVWPAALLFAAAAIPLVTLTVTASQRYQAARLIAENPILNVGIASITQVGMPEATVDVVVSGFGILMDGKPYQFGRGGIRLTQTAIDRERICLSFGDEETSYCVRLLHGVSNKADIERLKEQLRYETGVAATVSGW